MQPHEIENLVSFIDAMLVEQRIAKTFSNTNVAVEALQRVREKILSYSSQDQAIETLIQHCPIILSNYQAKSLVFLWKNCPRFVSSEELRKHLRAASTDSIKVHLTYLRQRLHRVPKFSIQSKYGAGYRILDPTPLVEFILAANPKLGRDSTLAALAGPLHPMKETKP